MHGESPQLTRHARAPQGWTQDRVVLPELLRRGLRPRTCCYNLHMWRATPCAAGFRGGLTAEAVPARRGKT